MFRRTSGADEIAARFSLAEYMQSETAFYIRANSMTEEV
jgi:hypothetical protein